VPEAIWSKNKVSFVLPSNVQVGFAAYQCGEASLTALDLGLAEINVDVSSNLAFERQATNRLTTGQVFPMPKRAEIA
jgi:hypothetical protein